MCVGRVWDGVIDIDMQAEELSRVCLFSSLHSIPIDPMRLPFKQFNFMLMGTLAGP